MALFRLQIAIVAQPLKEAVLAYFDAILVEQFSHFAYQDGGAVFVNRFSKIYARLVTLKVSVFALDELVLFLDGLFMLANKL